VDPQASPFVFDGPVPPEDLIGREIELAALKDRAVRGRYVLLYGPRRFGKTSIIYRLEADAAVTKDLAVVIVDLEGCQTMVDLARRIADAYSQLPRTALGRSLAAGAAALRNLRPTVTTPLGSVQLGTPEVHIAADPAVPAVERLLQLPYESAAKTGIRVLVVFDEFQAVADIRGADSVIRSQIQHQRDRVSYLFAGSEQHLLHAVFSDQARPLYGQAEHLEVGPLSDADVVRLVATKFETTGRDPGLALDRLVQLAEGHPQRAAFLADALWHETTPDSMADDETWEAALARALRSAGAEFEAIEAALSTTQRKLLRLLAWGEPATGAAATRLGLAKGSAVAALAVLRDRSIVLRPNGSRPHLVDPLLGAWIRARQPAP
jgi:hypothetical protein